MASRVTSKLANLVEDVEQGKRSEHSAQTLHEEVGDGPPILEECMGTCSDAYMWREESFKDRVRLAVGALMQAITDEAWKGMGDDGMKVKTWSENDLPGPSLHDELTEMLRKELFVNKYLPLLDKAKQIVVDHKKRHN